MLKKRIIGPSALSGAWDLSSHGFLLLGPICCKKYDIVLNEVMIRPLALVETWPSGLVW